MPERVLPVSYTHLVTNKSVALSEQAQAFVDFATSKDAADLIRTAGAVPVISAKDLNLWYGDFKALKGISLDVGCL